MEFRLESQGSRGQATGGLPRAFPPRRRRRRRQRAGELASCSGSGAEASGAARTDVRSPAPHAVPQLPLRSGPRRAPSQTRPQKAAAGRTRAAGRGRRREPSAWRSGARARAPAASRPHKRECARARAGSSLFSSPPLSPLSPAPLLHSLGCSAERVRAGKCGARWAGRRPRAPPARAGAARAKPDNVTPPTANKQPALPRPVPSRDWLRAAWWAGPAAGLGRAGGGRRKALAGSDGGG